MSDKKSEKKPNVIDMTERIQTPDYRERLKSLKVRLDLEHAKIAVSTSLLSIVVLVTLANNNLMTSIAPRDIDTETAPSIGRGIASVPGNAVSTVTDNVELVRELANRDLSPKASVGKKPTSLEKLAFGFLEGKYAVRLQNGKLREIEFTAESKIEDAKKVDNYISFIDNQRELLPEFAHSLKIGEGREGAHRVETFQLVNSVSMPVAKVQFRRDSDGRLLGMRVSLLQVAAK